MEKLLEIMKQQSSTIEQLITELALLGEQVAYLKSEALW